MKILKILLLILLTTGIQAKNNKWQPLKSLDEFPASAFNLKKGVAYLEIRQYRVNEERNKLKKKSYKTVLSLYRTPLDSFDPKTVKKFRKLAPNLSREGDIYRGDLQSSGVGCYYGYNGFLIDDQGKMYSMNMTEDVIGFLGEIDTPAEVQAVLWLHDKNSGSIYRKRSKGYDVIIEYEEEAGDSHDYCRKFKYSATIDKKGRLVKYKLVKTKKLKTMCIQPFYYDCNDD